MSRVCGMEVLRYTAFSDQPSGGNPAGVVLDPRDVDEATMLEVAAEVGYSETAYLWALDRAGSYRIRYYSPVAEVPFYHLVLDDFFPADIYQDVEKQIENVKQPRKT